MFFRIEPSNGIPIYEQIVRQVKYAIAEGTLVAGQMIPSVRELARELAINPNTIQRAYQQLQTEEVLESIRGRGLAVRKDAIRQCLSERQSLLRESFEQVVVEAVRSGLSVDQLRGIFEQSIKRVLKAEGANS